MTCQGMLQHTLLKDASKLDGMYAKALNRIYNQVTGACCARTPLHRYHPSSRIAAVYADMCLQRMRVLPAAVRPTGWLHCPWLLAFACLVLPGQ